MSQSNLRYSQQSLNLRSRNVPIQQQQQEQYQQRMDNEQNMLKITMVKLQKNMFLLILVITLIVLGYLSIKKNSKNIKNDESPSNQLQEVNQRDYKFEYIKYPEKINNITEFNQNIKQQIDNTLSDVDLKHIGLLDLLSKKLQDIYQEESLRGLSKKIDEYQGLQEILKGKYEDSIIVEEQIQQEVAFYEQCKQNVMDYIYKINIPTQPFYIEQNILMYEKQIDDIIYQYMYFEKERQQILNDYKQKENQYQQKLISLQYQDKYNKNSQKQVQELETQNQEYNEKLNIIKAKLIDIFNEKQRLQASIYETDENYSLIKNKLIAIEETILYLQLQIEEKKLSINLPKILRELDVDNKQEFADKVKQRLIILQKMYVHEVVSPQQKSHQEAEIIKLQSQYQTNMELVNSLKRTAFIQYSKGYKEEILKKEEELKEFVKTKEKYDKEIKILEQQKITFKNQFKTLDEVENDNRVQQIDLERKSQQNQVLLDQIKIKPNDQDNLIQEIQKKLQLLQAQFNRQIEELKQKIKALQDKQQNIQKLKDEQIEQLKNLKIYLMDFTRILNQKIYDCNLKLKYLNNIIVNGKNYISEINRFYETLNDLDNEINQLLLIKKQ